MNVASAGGELTFLCLTELSSFRLLRVDALTMPYVQNPAKLTSDTLITCQFPLPFLQIISSPVCLLKGILLQETYCSQTNPFRIHMSHQIICFLLHCHLLFICSKQPFVRCQHLIFLLSLSVIRKNP